MMRKLWVVALAGAIALTSGCTVIKVMAKGRPVKLTDDAVVKYVRAYRAVRAISPGAATALATPGNDDLQSAGAKYAEVVKALAKAGYKDPVDFMRANLSVGLAFSQLEAASAEGKMDKMKDEGLAKLDAAIADPNVPEATKAELKQKREMIVSTMENSRAWADRVLSVTHWMNDKDSIEAVRRHHDEILAAYTGQ